MVYRLILAKWAEKKHPERHRALEGEFTDEQLEYYNTQEAYNVYMWPNGPSVYNPNHNVKAADIDTFSYVFADMDLKEKKWESKQDFIDHILASDLKPTSIIDSGNGVHVYWAVTDLDAMSYLRLQRRLCRHFNTDEATSLLCQLMRVPGTYNTKSEGEYKLCEVLYESDTTYECEQLDRKLPKITYEDEQYALEHYDMAYHPEKKMTKVDVKLPLKFKKLMTTSAQVKELFAGDVKDRSKADYRLTHILFANGFTRDEAMSVLVNTAKAIERAPVHRIGYAEQMVDKVFTEVVAEDDPNVLTGTTITELLDDEDGVDAPRYPCSRMFDATAHGFRLTEVLGLIGGTGGGKSIYCLNMFYEFAKENPEYHHLYVTLEMPEKQIAKRWQKMSRGNRNLNDKVTVLGNYNKDGTSRSLSLHDIQEFVIAWEIKHQKKIGTIVIDHIACLKRVNETGEREGFMSVCEQLKSFAIACNSFVVVQSQTSREKAGQGDVELDKDAAYGTSSFEWFCDYIFTIWQPLKRIYSEAPDMTLTAFKLCKHREVDPINDEMKENDVYVVKFDVETGIYRKLTQEEETRYPWWLTKATKSREQDRKALPSAMKVMAWMKEEEEGANGNPPRTEDQS